ncbi:MAG: ATP synthase F0 subunit C [Deltaproteobacteria bacterium]|nr:ATP synthase F0 subunit C [Deltaproteobacteria bacterium]MBW2121199.1 ATP synthase F0 subunit C [Deltaproteobacteria bacterium]
MWVVLSAGFAMAIATLGGAISQGKGLTAALDGIARNPSAAGQMVTPMIIGLAMIESLVIYTLIIAFLILGKFA